MQGRTISRLTRGGLVALAGVIGGVLLSPLGSALAGHTTAILTASLDGRQEVAIDATTSRIVGDPNGRGVAYVFGIDRDPQTLCYVLVVEKIGPATAAHIHEGPPGTNGPVVVNLARPDDGDAADCLTEGEVRGGTPIFPTGETVAEILANPGSYYVNVHNADYPGGALRGQLEGR